MSNEKQLPIPKSCLERLLRPVNRLTESCVLKSNKDFLYTICSSMDNSVILYAKTNLPVEIDSLKMNLINIKKFLTGLECLGDDGEFKFCYNANSISCHSINDVTSENTYFKYHLVDDNIIKEAPVNIENIAKLKFDTIFEIPLAKIKQIMSAYTFVNDINKIYFYTKEKKVYAEINDKTLQNIDNVSLLISSDYQGEEISTPISVKIEIFKNLAAYKNPIKVKINDEFKVFVFNIQEDQNTELKYIVSALVK
jgi:hypothetical protein